MLEKNIRNYGYDYEVVMYGIKIIVFNVITVFICISIALLLNKFLFGLLFITIFSFLRIKYGGYHCKNPITCILTMIFVFFAVIKVSNYITHITNGVAALAIFLPLLLIQYKKNDYKGEILSVVLMIIISCLQINNYILNNIVLAILCAQLVFSFFYALDHFLNL